MAEAEHWQERYRTGDTPWETGHPSTELQRVLHETKLPPGRALDAGCGTGANAVWLARQNFDVTGVDISERAIEQARKRAADDGVVVRFLVADLCDPTADLTGPFDFIFDRGCYHVIRRAGRLADYLRTLDRLTHPGSFALFLAGNAREPRNPGPPVVSQEDLEADLGSLFEILRLTEMRFDPTPSDPVGPLAWSCLARRKGAVGS
jgi:2-polyprenyl-3-methyl-5-hydroxy-6-metoxy-1,4-benzoquinol methylase